ncbi:AAA family ATPase [Pseudosulfitobacter sp. SM2401]|uniref:AAA family ATPase n=1 Tax=Pseudosulfitobacter sp. SM2401 TaxID=3350098 RepID=UPI0036F43592
MSAKFILITGCSGGGKSEILCELSARGFATVPEPGRRIVAQELSGSGQALPWVDMGAFARRAVLMAQRDLRSAVTTDGPVFFDRGLIDAAVALNFATTQPYRKTLGQKRHYSKQVFFAPPWPEIFAPDTERRHDFTSAVAETSRLETAFLDLGYDICPLPKWSVKERADFILDRLRRSEG